MSDFWRLHGFDWLAGLSEWETERLLSRSRSRECARGEIVFEPASSPRSVYLLEKCLVRIFRLSARGSEVTFGYVRRGEVFGELQAIAERVRGSRGRRKIAIVALARPLLRIVYDLLRDGTVYEAKRLQRSAATEPRAA